MRENKCPFCGEAMITTEDKIVLCENADCATMFNEWDYPKVCAAMDLAKLTVQMKTCRAYCPERAFLYAQDRVLEVFK